MPVQIAVKIASHAKIEPNTAQSLLVGHAAACNVGEKICAKRNLPNRMCTTKQSAC